MLTTFFQITDLQAIKEKHFRLTISLDFLVYVYPCQAFNQDFPKGDAKRDVVVWVQEHRVKRSERGGGLQEGRAPLHNKIFKILV